MKLDRSIKGCFAGVLSRCVSRCVWILATVNMTQYSLCLRTGKEISILNPVMVFCHNRSVIYSYLKILACVFPSTFLKMKAL